MKVPAFKPINGWRTFAGEVGIMVFKSKHLINDIGKLGLSFDPAAIRTSHQDLLDLQRDYRGSCVEPLPLDAGFDGPVMGERPAAVR